MNILELNGLTKQYGKLLAVNELNLQIQQGQVYGILGPNGSGKTTTLGMILDVVAPSSGDYRWFGGMSPIKARQQIGAILETPCFYPYMTAEQNLRISAHIKECSAAKISEVLKQVGLFERRKDKFKTYSLGMKQRLSIGAALLADPPVLILDEPTNGLDPEGIAEIRTLIQEIAQQGKTIILASHLLDEVQKVCTHFCILKNGNKVHEGLVNDITGTTRQIRITSQDLSLLKTTLQQHPGLSNLATDGPELIADLQPGTTTADINRFCFEQGITLSKLQPVNRTLEQEFLTILKANQ
ncbi:ABC transporter ATP-binding protein [Marinoscillum furvescens]|uniref:ABC-2 type transport system ATP-binding protein n=1 Tax=Marinoscillum furvescens DSM 4134 TaxID=1122208 RepID=A0A3D9L556_MARFU|nr:ATP-binding cassette domain-containing protein [Marinoscillum furvescens]RED99455.1 ABC-2 type transport system ATP-binding protein [Marinoscillum furvescens DSM 4134]